MSDRPAATAKCVVWDLDGTLWEGVLAEGGATALRPGVEDTLRALDERGILSSIASKNAPGPARARLAELGVDHWFVTPQISWDPKSDLVARVAEELNIGIDTLVLVDDQEFERAEVASVHPGVRCVDAAEVGDLLARPELAVPVTAEGRNRRRMYQEAAVRKDYEESFAGPRSAFLASLGMRLTVRATVPEDLDRAAELTQRTHQLNTTGLVFDQPALSELMQRDDHRVLSVELSDRFGDYGMIGLVLVRVEADSWRIRLLLMSCRVMGRNVGGAVLAFLAGAARDRGLDLTADFLPNEVNRPMFAVYRLAGFAVEHDDGAVRHLRLRPDVHLTVPDYLSMTATLGHPSLLER